MSLCIATESVCAALTVADQKGPSAGEQHGTESAGLAFCQHAAG